MSELTLPFPRSLAEKQWWDTATLYELAGDLARADDLVWAGLERDDRDRYVRTAEAAMRFVSTTDGDLLERARDEGYAEAISDVEVEVSCLSRSRRR